MYTCIYIYIYIYVYVYTHIHTCICLSVYDIYIHIYIYTHTYVYIYIYIYIYLHLIWTVPKGTNVSALMTNGVTSNFMFFDRGTFWVLPSTYFCLPRSARAYLVPPNLSKFTTFAAAPLALTLFVHNQSFHTASLLSLLFIILALLLSLCISISITLVLVLFVVLFLADGSR